MIICGFLHSSLVPTLTVWDAYGPGPSKQTAGSLRSIQRLQGTPGTPVLSLQPGSTATDRCARPFLNCSLRPAYRRIQWRANATVAPYRLPTKGPTFPVSFPVLVIVTQSLHVEMWYLRARHFNFSFIRAALIHGAPGHELQPPAPLAPHTSSGGTKLCVTAAIGVTYDGESSVLEKPIKRRASRFKLPPCSLRCGQHWYHLRQLTTSTVST